MPRQVNKQIARARRFFHPREPEIRMGGRGRPTGPGLWAALLVAAVILFPATLAAQDTMGDPPLPSDLSTLIEPEQARWLAAVEEMRAAPRAARESLVAALRAEVVSPLRWRLFHHMVEFGEPGDIPVLLENLKRVEQPREREILLGAVRALYHPVVGKTDLANAVEEFAFVQTRPPERVKEDFAGRWTVGDEEIRAFHRAAIPIEPLLKLARMKGRGYDSAEDFAEALQKRLGREDWEAHGSALTRLATRRPVHNLREGLLRFQLFNPLQQPLLLRVDFDAWAGAFSPQPESAYVFLEPGKTERVDIPARLVHPQGPTQLRIDLRLREVGGKLAAVYRKLYLAE